MCLGISSPEGGSITLTFVQEQIYLSKDGSKQVRADILIKNTGNIDVKRFRIELPCRLLTIKELTPRDDELEPDSYKRICSEQLLRIHISTNKLVQSSDPANWLYGSLPGLSLDNYDREKGTLTVKRGKEPLTGIVKQGW